MNQRYNQQNNYQNSTHNRSQYSHSRDQAFRREQLERELDWLERNLASLDAQIDAIGEKDKLLEAAKNAHIQSVPWAIAQVALSTLGVRHLPPVARTWHYKYQQYLRAEEALKQHAVTLYYKREALIAQIEQIQIKIDMLQFQP